MFPGNAPVLGKGPSFVSCHICGQKFGKQSMKFHVPQCEKKFEAQQQLLPKHLRKAVPKPIKPGIQVDSFANMTSAEIEKYNTVTDDQYNTKVLVPCSKCGRTFFPESLLKHEPVCSAKPLRKDLSSTQPLPSTPTPSGQSSPSLSATQQVSKAKSPRTFSIEEGGDDERTDSSPTPVTPVRKIEKKTIKKKSSEPIQVHVEGVIPVRVKKYGNADDPQGYISLSIIKELGCQMEGEGPDEEGRYILSGFYNDEEEDGEILYESPSWPRKDFQITFKVSSKYETLPLEEVEKDQTDNILTLFFPVSQKTLSTRKKIQL